MDRLPDRPPSPAATAVWPSAAPPTGEGPLLGRDDLVETLVEGLLGGRDRAVCLSGLGGVGKSRLAAAVAARVGASWDGRVAWIELGRLPRERAVMAGIAGGLDLDVAEPDHLAEVVAETIGEAPALLVLDAAEAARDELGFVSDLLDLAPGVAVLVTSRIGHGVTPFLAIEVPPLDTPADDAPLEVVAASPAVRLLIDRARAAGAEVPVTTATAPSLARLVERLDGLPLAIELAAPVLRTLPVHQLLDRLDAGLDSLRATMDGTPALLDAECPRLSRRLGTFTGPFTLEDVRIVIERGVEHGLARPAVDLADVLGALATASLVRVHDPETSHAPARYELPALVRDDAARRLDASGEGTAARWAHANCLLDLAEEIDAQLTAKTDLALLRRLDAVHDELLAALDRSHAAGATDFLLRLSGALAEYWRARGRLTEGRLWLEAALRTAPRRDSAERARALHGAGMLANWQSDFPRAKVLLEEALGVRMRLGQLAEAASTLNQLGLIGLDQGDLDEAERHCRQGLDIRRSLGDDGAIAASLNTLGGVLHFGGRQDDARAMFEESLAIRRALGDEAGSSVSLGNLALIARDLGDLDGADAMLREAIATRERLGDRQRVAVVRHNHALVLFDLGRLDEARDELETSLAIARELGDRLETANALSDLGFVEEARGARDRAGELQGEALVIAQRIGAKGIAAQAIDGIAGLVASGGDVEDGATLWAAAETIRRAARYNLLLADRRRIDAAISAARERLDDETWWRAWAAGEALDLEASILRAKVALGTSGERPRAAV